MLPDDNIRELARKTAKSIVDHGSIPMATLKESIILQDKVNELLEKEIEFPEVEPFPEFPDYPTSIEVTNLPEVQKVEIVNHPKEKDDKEQITLLKEISQELKKKEEYAYDIEIDSTLKEQLKGDKGDVGENGKDGNKIEPKEIVDKLESLDGDERLDVSAVRGTEALIEDIAKKIAKEEVKKVKKTTVISGGGIQSVVAGTNVTVDNTDPLNPIINANDSVGIPATTVVAETTYGLSTAVGTSTNYAREDHSHGSQNNPMTAVGDMIVGGATGTPTSLPVGTNGEVLTLVAGTPSWEAAASFTIEEAQDAVGAMADSESLVYTDVTPLLAVKVQQSITKDASGLKLSGDSSSPGNNQVYGTDASGVKGWKADPSAGSGFTKDTIGVTVDGGGSVVTTGSKGYKVIQEACTITGWTILGKESGSVVVDIKKCTYAGFPTTSTITGTEKPTLSSAQKNQDLTLTTWTTSLLEGDILEFIVDSASTCTRFNLFINITK
jgi:hypothetical protein